MNTHKPFHGSGRAVFPHPAILSGNNTPAQRLRRPRLAWLGIFVSLLSVAACNDDRVPIPPAQQDKAPVISVNAVASGGSGQIQYPEAMPSSCASPCKDAVRLTDENGTADVVLIINAKNPGGVKDLSVVVSQNGPLYTAATSSTPDAQNRVPTTLTIAGTNNAGGIGSNPLLIHLDKIKTSATVVALSPTASACGVWSCRLDNSRKRKCRC